MLQCHRCAWTQAHSRFLQSPKATRTMFCCTVVYSSRCFEFLHVIITSLISTSMQDSQNTVVDWVQEWTVYSNHRTEMMKSGLCSPFSHFSGWMVLCARCEPSFVYPAEDELVACERPDCIRHMLWRQDMAVLLPVHLHAWIHEEQCNVTWFRHRNWCH